MRGADKGRAGGKFEKTKEGLEREENGDKGEGQGRGKGAKKPKDKDEDQETMPNWMEIPRHMNMVMPDIDLVFHYGICLWRGGYPSCI